MVLFLLGLAVFAGEASCELAARQERFEVDAWRDEMGPMRVEVYPAVLVAAYSEVADDLARCLVEDPEEQELRWLLADTLVQAQRWEEAEVELDRLWETREEHDHGEDALVEQVRVLLRLCGSEEESSCGARLVGGETGLWGVEVHVLDQRRQRLLDTIEQVLASELSEDLPPDIAAEAVELFLAPGADSEGWEPRGMDSPSWVICTSVGELLEPHPETRWLRSRGRPTFDLCYLEPPAEEPPFVDEPTQLALLDASLRAEANGQTLAARGLRARLARMYLDFIEEQPNSVHHPDALLGAAEQYDAMGARKQALELFERFVDAYPDDERAQPLYLQVAADYEARGELEKAVYFDLRLERHFPDYEDAPLAIRRAAALKQRMGQTRDAAKLYEYLAVKFEPDGAEEVFWLATELWEEVSPEAAAASCQRWLERFSLADPERITEAWARIAELEAASRP